MVALLGGEIGLAGQRGGVRQGGKTRLREPPTTAGLGLGQDFIGVVGAVEQGLFLAGIQRLATAGTQCGIRKVAQRRVLDAVNLLHGLLGIDHLQALGRHDATGAGHDGVSLLDERGQDIWCRRSLGGQGAHGLAIALELAHGLLERFRLVLGGVQVGAQLAIVLLGDRVLGVLLVPSFRPSFDLLVVQLGALHVGQDI